MAASNFCKICGGKTGFTNTESRRHEATTRHVDAVADLAFAKQDAPKIQKGRKAVAAGISGILSGTATAESVLSDPDVAAVLPVVETPTGEVEATEAPDIDLGPVVDESGAPTDQTLAVLTDAAPAKAPAKDEVADLMDAGHGSEVAAAENFLAAGGTVAELKAIRMRAKWAAERIERRSQKAPKDRALAKAVEAAWTREKIAYAIYRQALGIEKDAKAIAAAK